MVFVTKREVCEERDDNAISAVVPISAVYIHNCRRHVLCEICTYHPLPEDCKFFDPALLRSCKSLFFNINDYDLIEVLIILENYTSKYLLTVQFSKLLYMTQVCQILFFTIN